MYWHKANFHRGFVTVASGNPYMFSSFTQFEKYQGYDMDYDGYPIWKKL